MLRVGLTGELSSGKSTVARMLAERGAHVFSSDDMGRALMQPGEDVYAQIVETFGAGVVAADGTLDRSVLARLAFAEGRVEELNAIVHPAVLAEQARRMAEIECRESPARETNAQQAGTIVVVESALIFSTTHSGAVGGWGERFDEILLVTAPEAVKLARFVERAGAGMVLDTATRARLAADGQRRLAAQRSAKTHDEDCIVIRNNGDLQALKKRVDEVWRALQRKASA